MASVTTSPQRLRGEASHDLALAQLIHLLNLHAGVVQGEVNFPLALGIPRGAPTYKPCGIVDEV